MDEDDGEGDDDDDDDLGWGDAATTKEVRI